MDETRFRTLAVSSPDSVRRLVRIVGCNAIQTQARGRRGWEPAGPLRSAVVDPDLYDVVAGIDWVKRHEPPRERRGTVYLGDT